MAMVRLDKVKAAYCGNIESVEYDSSIKNGTVWVLGPYVSGEREIHSLKPCSVEDLEGVMPFVLHASPEHDYTNRKKRLSDFELEALTPGRAYHLAIGDVITVTANLFDAEPAADQYVVPSILNPGNFMPTSDGTVEVEDTTYNSRLILRYIEKTTLGTLGSPAYALKVVRC